LSDFQSGEPHTNGEHLSQQTWLAEVEHEATATAVCGLEISFQSIPQEKKQQKKQIFYF
jgi:hypothetical protein